MHRWWVLLHMVGVAGFLLFHGVSTVVALRLRSFRDRGRIDELLQISGWTIIPFYVSLLMLLAGGIAAGFTGAWWGMRWIWVSLFLLIAVMVLMYALATPYYRHLRKVIQMRPSGNPVISDEELEALLASPRPMINVVIGFAGLLAILYLMVFKPF